MKFVLQCCTCITAVLLHVQGFTATGGGVSECTSCIYNIGDGAKISFPFVPLHGMPCSYSKWCRPARLIG